MHYKSVSKPPNIYVIKISCKGTLHLYTARLTAAFAQVSYYQGLLINRDGSAGMIDPKVGGMSLWSEKCFSFVAVSCFKRYKNKAVHVHIKPLATPINSKRLWESTRSQSLNLLENGAIQCVYSLSSKMSVRWAYASNILS